jgi:phosphomannomutase
MSLSSFMLSDFATSNELSSLLQENIRVLCASSSDVRGRFMDHSETLKSVVEAMNENSAVSTYQPLTPLLAYFLGCAFAEMICQSILSPTICIGMDPRSHGRRLAEAFAFGLESYAKKIKNGEHCTVVFTGIATTPACASLVRLGECDAAVVRIPRIATSFLPFTATHASHLAGFQMVTASHLPPDRNGFKFFSTLAPSGFTKTQIQALGNYCQRYVTECLETNAWPMLLPGNMPSIQQVDWMPIYAESLQKAVRSNTVGIVSDNDMPLAGLKIVLNPGNGAGGFFQYVLYNLGADVSASINLDADESFPNGVPNPETKSMLQQTIAACSEAQADLGIMLDTDADRCGFVTPRTIDNVSGRKSGYEALNRNRLIALLAVVFAREKPGCAVVTDSVTSEGLSNFLTHQLGLEHVRFIKGYANVISKARELTDSGSMNAELAIETSGHCAMRENGYLDDGTYTAVKIVSLLARERAMDATRQVTLLDLIGDMEELDEVCELRMTTKDSSLNTMRDSFDACITEISRYCESNEFWQVDNENLEGIRVRFGLQGQFFMVRQSLHDPIISLQIEAQSKREAREMIVEPLRNLFESNKQIKDVLNMDVLADY